MKNLKRLSRNDLKIIVGETDPKADDSITGEGGGNGGDTFKCCNTTTGSCGHVAGLEPVMPVMN